MPLSVERIRAAAERVHNELDRAIRTWTIFEALNGVNESHRAPLRRQISTSSEFQVFKLLEFSVVNSVILALSRVVDRAPPAKSDRLTLDVIAFAVRDEDVLQRCCMDARAWNPGMCLEDHNEALVRRLFRKIERRTTDQGPHTRLSLFSVRKALKPIRDHVLAHSIDLPWTAPQLRMVRRFLIFCATLSRDGNLAIRGLEHDYRNLFESSLKQANEFWDSKELGMVAIRDARTLENIMDLTAERAKARGLTPEIFHDVLKEK